MLSLKEALETFALLCRLYLSGLQHSLIVVYPKFSRLNQGLKDRITVFYRISPKIDAADILRAVKISVLNYPKYCNNAELLVLDRKSQKSKNGRKDSLNFKRK